MQFRLLRALACLTCVWFFAATLYSACFIELGFDPAYHAVVAKNFAQGYGWATSYDSRFLFNPDVTTGPALLLPVAAMIALFGNAIWVPGVTAAIVQLLLYGAILWRLRGYYQQAKPFWLTVIALNLVFVIHAHTWWYTLTADFLVCLVLILSCLYAAAPRPERAERDLLCAGLLLGYALLAKVLAWFGIAAFAVYGLLQLWHSHDRKAALKRGGAVILGILIMLTPWKIYQEVSLLQLSDAQRTERTEYKNEFFLTQGTGIQEIADSNNLPELVLENLLRNGEILQTQLYSRYHLPVLALIALILYLYTATLKRLRHHAAPMQRLLLLLGLVACIQLFWYLFISHSWIAKYALTPLVIGLLMLCLALAQAGRLLPGILVLGALTVFLPTDTQAYIRNLLSFGAQQTAYTRDLLSTRDYLISHPSSVPLAGCGWVFAPWEMEYALPGIENFRDCRRLIAEGLQLVPGTAVYTWAHPVEFRLVISHLFWEHSIYRDQYQVILQACLPAPLHHTEYFTVALCTADALRQHIALDRPSEFLPTGEKHHFIHKPLPAQ